MFMCHRSEARAYQEEQLKQEVAERERLAAEISDAERKKYLVCENSGCRGAEATSFTLSNHAPCSVARPCMAFRASEAT